MHERPFSSLYGFLKVVLIISLTGVVSCSSVRKLPEGAALLTKNEIQLSEGVRLDLDLEDVLRQKENKKILGIPLKLWIFNASGSKNSTIGRWFRSKGEPPVILDSIETALSVARLNRALRKQGYFNVYTSFDLDYSPNLKKVKQRFFVSAGDPFTIDGIGYKLPNQTLLDSLSAYKKDRLIHPQDPLNIDTLEKERQRILFLLRDRGAFGLQKSDIYFEIDGDTTQTNRSKTVKVTTVIDSTAAIQTHRLGKINVLFDQLNTTVSTPTDTVNGIVMYPTNENIDLDVLEERIAFKPGILYRDSLRITTLNRIGQLNYFSYPSINYTIQDDSIVNINLYLRSRKRYSLTADFDLTHSAIQQIGTSLRSSVLARNVFGSFENLSLSLSGTIGNSIIPGANITSELGIDLNLSFPRWWYGFSLDRLIAMEKNPISTLQIGTVFQQNLGLDRQTINAIYRFSFTNKSSQHTVEFPKISYVNNLNPDNFFSIYRNTYETLDELSTPLKSDSRYADLFESTGVDGSTQLQIPDGTAAFISGVQDESIPLNETDALLVSRIEERRARLTENNLILSSSYALLNENTTNRNASAYRQYYAKFELAGFLFDALEPFSTPGELFDVAYAHYLKTELQFIKHWPLGTRSSAAFRAYGGFALPLGRSSSVPFVRSFFAGGTNDIRGWNAYTLGPGTTNQLNEFNDANLKLTLSAELRFPLSRSLYGAVFTDAGNIWNALDGTENEAAIFHGWRSLKDSAIASGFGLRYDFDYFIFRLDLAYKLLNPALQGDERWIFNRSNNSPLFNIGINYPF
jgi:outer membrane protein assembly factor BamA